MQNEIAMTVDEMEPIGELDGNTLSEAQRKWLSCGLEQAGGKLPLFDEYGQQINPQTVQSCIRNGWAEPWFANPLKPDWLVCKLTDLGKEVLSD